MDNFLKKLNEQRDVTLQDVVEDAASKIFEATTQTYLSQPGETTGHNLWVAMAKRHFQVFDATGRPTGETLGDVGLYESNEFQEGGHPTHHVATIEAYKLKDSAGGGYRGVYHNHKTGEHVKSDVMDSLESARNFAKKHAYERHSDDPYYSHANVKLKNHKLGWKSNVWGSHQGKTLSEETLEEISDNLVKSYLHKAHPDMINKHKQAAAATAQGYKAKGAVAKKHFNNAAKIEHKAANREKFYNKGEDRLYNKEED